MPKLKNYYEILGVSEGADADTIKKAYRKLARQYHPDKNPDDAQAEERFKGIQEAYSVLSDVQQRKQYDRARKNPLGDFGDPGGFETGNGNRYYRSPDGTYVRFETGGDAGFGDAFGGVGDFFSTLFGGSTGQPQADPFAGQQHRAAQARDVESTIRLSFDEALQGGKTEVHLPDGEKVRLTIPKGVQPGFKIRLRDRGEPGPGGRRGDLYVTFEVDPHPRFRREGNDLHVTETVGAFDAILGTTRYIENAYGKQIKVPLQAGTQPGTKLRLKGQGVRTEKRTGDLYVEIEIHLPEGLTERQLEILRIAAEEADLK